MNLADVKHLFNYTEWANELAMVAASMDPPVTDLIFYVRREISPK